MTRIEFFTSIKDIVNTAKDLQEKHFPHADVQLDLVGIFAQDKDEMERFLKNAEEVGMQIEENVGKQIFFIKTPYPTKLGSLRFITLHSPDITQKKRGYVELKVPDFEVFTEAFGFKMNPIGHPLTHTLELFDTESQIFMHILKSPYSSRVN